MELLLSRQARRSCAPQPLTAELEPRWSPPAGLALSKVASAEGSAMTYARSGTCRAGRRCVGGFVRDCQTQHNAETNLAPLRRGFFVEVACTLSQASPVDDDHLFGRRHRNQSASTSFKRWAYRSRCVPGSVAAQTRMRAGTTGKPPRCSSPLSPAALWRGFFIRVASDFRHSNQKLGSAFSRWLAVQRRSPFSRVSFLVLGSGAGRQALCELTSARFGGAFRVSVPVRRATDDASAALSGGLAANALSPFSPKWRAAGVRSARPATPLFVVTAGHLEGRDVVEEIGCCDRRAS